MMMMMMLMMELGSFSYLGTYLLVTSYYCTYVLQSEPVPDATAQSRFTNKQTKQDKTGPV